MKKLIIIFVILFMVAFLIYSVYHFIFSFNWLDSGFISRWFNIGSGFHMKIGNSSNRTDENLFVFKDNYIAKVPIRNLKLDLTGLNIKIVSYDGTSVSYDISITSNFNLKVGREISGNTLILRTYPNFGNNKKVKKSLLTIKIPKKMRLLTTDLIGCQLSMSSCNFSDVNFDMTGVKLSIDNVDFNTLNSDLTGVDFDLQDSTLNNINLDVTGGKLNFDSLVTSDFSLNLTGGKSDIYFSKYENISVNLTGGDVRLYGISRNSDFIGKVSFGQVEIFGKKYLRDFNEPGSDGTVEMNVSSGKLEISEGYF